MDDHSGEEVKRVNDVSGVIDPELEDSLSSEAAGKSLEIVESWVNDEISDERASKKIETVQSAIRDRKMAKARRRLPQVIRYVEMDEEEKVSKDDSTLSIGPSSGTSEVYNVSSTSSSPKSVPKSRSSSRATSGGSSPPSTEETPEEVRFQRRYPTDYEPMTPPELKSKVSPGYCHVDAGVPDYSRYKEYPVMDYRHPALQKSLDLRDRYISDLETRIAQHCNECRLNCNRDMARADRLDDRIQDLRETLNQRSQMVIDSSVKRKIVISVDSEEPMETKDEADKDKSVIEVGDSPKSSEVQQDENPEEKEDLTLQETEEEMNRINLRSEFDIPEELPSPSPSPERKEDSEDQDDDDEEEDELPPLIPPPEEPTPDDGDQQQSGDASNPVFGPNLEHGSNAPLDQSQPTFDPNLVTISGPSDSEWVIADPPVEADPVCVACGETKCEEEIDCMENYLNMMDESDDSTYKVQFLLRNVFYIILLKLLSLRMISDCLCKFDGGLKSISQDRRLSPNGYLSPSVFFIFV